ncbi:hypothetical protein ACTHUM_14530 [Neisseria sp. P0021.S006]|uniref:hypothetical protein n=1 Tax=Neisseria sp. P0021.S006 TaxID=3436821 RepID=UPI003F7F08EE
MRQVYKGEIEEKNQAASSNSTARIILAFYPLSTVFPSIFKYFAKKQQIRYSPLFLAIFAHI